MVMTTTHNDEFSLVIATRNEAKNLPFLIESLALQINNSPEHQKFEIIFIDDDSEDDCKIIRDFITRYKDTRVHINLIERKGKRGTVGAQITGAKAAKFRNIIVLDGDLQHPIKLLTPMIELLDDETDLVIASRRAKGGGNAFGFRRKLISTIARLLSYLLIPHTRSISDPLSGFFISKREHIIKLKEFESFNKLLLYIIVSNPNVRVKEYPMFMNERTRGESKIVKSYRRLVINFLRELKTYYRIQQRARHGLKQ